MAASDINSVTLEVLDGADVLIAPTLLTKAGGSWLGTMELLPVNTELTFIARAYDINGVEIFNGTTAITLDGTKKSLSMSLQPVSDGASISLPKVTQISRPAKIQTSGIVPVTFDVSGPSGDTIYYQLTADVGGGSFSQTQGSVVLAGTTGQIVVDYTAPAIVGSYTHNLKISTSDTHSISSNFSTLIVTPAEVTEGSGNAGSLISFNPVIHTISAKRDSSNNLVWTASVSDDGDTNLMTYFWSYTDNAVSFADATANPAVMQGYSVSSTGTLTLIVTDDAGASTSVNYAVQANEFPEITIESTAGGVAFDIPADPTDGTDNRVWIGNYTAPSGGTGNVRVYINTSTVIRSGVFLLKKVANLTVNPGLVRGTNAPNTMIDRNNDVSYSGSNYYNFELGDGNNFDNISGMAQELFSMNVTVTGNVGDVIPLNFLVYDTTGDNDATEFKGRICTDARFKDSCVNTYKSAATWVSGQITITQ
ncbi:MAG: hypothetical protein HQM11_21275 [SAR324 cluster bacterium]|nr:hypothetical protein [SAR324 cluster bacterium]